MKSTIFKSQSAFTPVTVSLTFESKSELAAFLLLVDSPNAYEFTIDELKGRPELEQYNPLSFNVEDLIDINTRDALLDALI